MTSSLTNIYHITRRHIPEDSNLHNDHGENLKSLSFSFYVHKINEK
jgi:hypothetical protein